LTEAKTNKEPLFHIDIGNIPGTTVTMHFNGQALHSHITVLKEADLDGGNSSEHTIRNVFVPVAYTFRPKVVTQTSGDDVSTEEYAKQLYAAELKNITLVIETDRWEVDGNMIEPNNIITVYDPEVFIYIKTKWFIESCELKGDEKATTMVITCVLPCVYDGTTPENIFVNPHENLPRF